jgi:hypothetical protein
MRLIETQHVRRCILEVACLCICESQSRSLGILIYQQQIRDIEDKRTQEPPKTCHLSIPRCSRIRSTSLTRSHVVLSSRDALLHAIRHNLIITLFSVRSGKPRSTLIEEYYLFSHDSSVRIRRTARINTLGCRPYTYRG